MRGVGGAGAASGGGGPSRLVASLVVLATLAAAHGCARVRRPPPVVTEHVQALTAVAAVELARELAKRGERLEAIAGRARLELQTPQGTWRGQTVVQARRPADLRIEGVGLFGERLFLLQFRDEKFDLEPSSDIVAGPLSRTRHGGRDQWEAFAREFGLSLTPEELVEVLLGGYPRASVVARAETENAVAAAAVERGGERWVRLFVGRGRSLGRLYLVRPEDLAIMRMALVQATDGDPGPLLAGTEESLYTAGFAAHESVGEVSFATAIEWQERWSQRSLAVQFRSPRVELVSQEESEDGR